MRQETQNNSAMYKFMFFPLPNRMVIVMAIHCYLRWRFIAIIIDIPLYQYLPLGNDFRMKEN